MKNLFSWCKSHPIKTILIVVLAYPILWILFLFVSRFIYTAKKEIAKPKVEAIHARKLDMDTILGKNIPPEPNPTENDKTVLGIDSNNNGIRDDVEIYLHKKYSNQTKIRAAQLQYAMAIQATLGDPGSSDEMIALAQEEGRAEVCSAQIIGKALRKFPNWQDLIFKDNTEALTRKFVLNTQQRQLKVEKNSELIADSYSSDFGKENPCDFNQDELQD